MTPSGLKAVPTTRFSAEVIYERGDLQRHLKENISVLADDLMVIAEEYCEWVDSNRRIDLLCIDTAANIVVVEIKRTEDGGHMELQAIRYAAMLSKMTFEQLVESHKTYLRASGKPPEDASGAILSFLGWSTVDEDAFANVVRIILAAAEFSKEITTSVMWLNEYDIDIRCVRLKPYRLSDKHLLLDVQQIIPLPEAADYQTKIRAKQQAERENQVERHKIRFQFWAELLEHAKPKTTLFSSKKPTEAGGFGVPLGKATARIGFLTRGLDSEVQIEIDNTDANKNSRIFSHFEQHRAEIGDAFDGDLLWDKAEGKRAHHIRHVVQGGWKSPQEDWPVIHANLVDKVIELDAALRPIVESLTA